jgi:hypothetical protein
MECALGRAEELQGLVLLRPRDALLLHPELGALQLLADLALGGVHPDERRCD